MLVVARRIVAEITLSLPQRATTITAGTTVCEVTTLAKRKPVLNGRVNFGPVTVYGVEKQSPSHIANDARDRDGPPSVRLATATPTTPQAQHQEQPEFPV